MLKYELRTARGVKTVVRNVDLNPPYQALPIPGSDVVMLLADDWTFSNQYGERRMPPQLKHVRHDQRAHKGTVLRRTADHVRGTVDFSDCGIVVVGVLSDAHWCGLMGTLEIVRWTLEDSIPVHMVK